LSGWVGYTNTSRLLSTAGGLFDVNLDIWNYAVTLAFPDLGKQGNLLGFVVETWSRKSLIQTISSSKPDLDVE